MARILTSIIFICILSSVTAQLFMFPKTSDSTAPKDIKRETLDLKARTSSGWVVDVKNWIWLKSGAAMEGLKNPSEPNVNLRNRCIWKICSKPLRSLGLNETASLKEMKNKLPLSTNLG